MIEKNMANLQQNDKLEKYTIAFFISCGFQKLSPLSSSVPPENNNNIISHWCAHKSSAHDVYLFLLLASTYISSVRQHQEPGQLHNSQPFYLNRIFQKSGGNGSYKLCCSSALSSRKVSGNEISVLIDTSIFQKGDGITFNVQETISQRITQFKKHRKYKMTDLILWLYGQVIYFWPIFLSRNRLCFIILPVWSYISSTKNQHLMTLNNSCPQRIRKFSQCLDTYQMSSTWNSSSTNKTQSILYLPLFSPHHFP